MGESIQVLGEAGFLARFASAAKDHGVSLGIQGVFDTSSASAHSGQVSDTTLQAISQTAPKALTNPEKVCYMEEVVNDFANDAPRHGLFNHVTSTSYQVSDPTPEARSHVTLKQDTNMHCREQFHGGFTDIPRHRLETREATHAADKGQIDSEVLSHDNLMLDESPNSGVKTDDHVIWTHRAVLLLIELYRNYKHLILNSTVTKTQVWRRISDEMKVKGYVYSGDDCDRKFRSLKKRYKIIKDRRSRTGEGRNSWQYFDLLENLFDSDPAVTPINSVSSQRMTRSSTSTPSPRPEPSATATSSSSPSPICSPPASTVTSTPVRRASSTSQASRHRLQSLPQNEPEWMLNTDKIISVSMRSEWRWKGDGNSWN